MIGWGIMLVIIGVGSFVLPLMGYQFKLISIFGEAAPVAAIVIAVIGVALIIFGLAKKKKTA